MQTVLLPGYIGWEQHVTEKPQITTKTSAFIASSSSTFSAEAIKLKTHPHMQYTHTALTTTIVAISYATTYNRSIFICSNEEFCGFSYAHLIDFRCPISSYIAQIFNGERALKCEYIVQEPTNAEQSCFIISPTALISLYIESSLTPINSILSFVCLPR